MRVLIVYTGCGGYGSPQPVYAINTRMDYVQFMTEGNSTDFGDFTQKSKQGAPISNGHGGLG